MQQMFRVDVSHRIPPCIQMNSKVQMNDLSDEVQNSDKI